MGKPSRGLFPEAIYKVLDFMVKSTHTQVPFYEYTKWVQQDPKA